SRRPPRASTMTTSPAASRRPIALLLAISFAVSCARPAAAPAPEGGTPTATPSPRQVPATPAQGDARYSGTFAGGWRFPELREAAFGDSAMVASNSDLASQAGLEVLRQGGNAMDAAVAVGFAL